MKRTVSISTLLVVGLVVGCGLKTRGPDETREPTVVETPAEEGNGSLDIEAEIGGPSEATEVPLPMETEFVEWRVVVDEAPQVARITDRLTRTVTFELVNTLERLLTGQIVIEAPRGVLVVPGETIGWRVRGGRSAAIPARVTIPEGAPLGCVTLPVSVTVLGQPYRRGRLELCKWFDVRAIGPFPVDASAPDAVYPPEKSVDFDKGCTWQDARFAWEPLPLDALQPDGMIDFRQLFGETATGCAYAALHVRAAAAAGVVLAFACDSPSTVWLNGQRVLTAPDPLRQESTVEVTLQRGANTLLVKCRRAETGWAFVLNLVGKQGELPPGVQFDLVLRGELARESVVVPTEAPSDK